MNNDDARMVAERIGLDPDTADEVQNAFSEVEMLGLEGFEDQTLREVLGALVEANAGHLPTGPVIRRAQVRSAVAVALRQFITLRHDLATYDGPKH